MTGARGTSMMARCCHSAAIRAPEMQKEMGQLGDVSYLLELNESTLSSFWEYLSVWELQ